MSAKPATVPRWANVGGLIVTPPSGKLDIGFLTGERPPAEYINWALNWNGQWAQYVSDGDLALHSITNSTTIVSTGQITANGGLSSTTIVASGLTTAAAITASGLITASAGVTLASNQQLKLQGTGYVQRGTRQTVVPVIPNTVCGGGSGTVSSNGTNPGAVWAVSSSGYIPCNIPDADNELAQITSVTVRNGITGTGNVTLQLYMADWATGLFISIGSSTALAINSGLSVSPTSPTTLTPGNTLWVKVTTAGTNSGAVYAVETFSTVP